MDMSPCLPGKRLAAQQLPPLCDTGSAAAGLGWSCRRYQWRFRRIIRDAWARRARTRLCPPYGLTSKSAPRARRSTAGIDARMVHAVRQQSSEGSVALLVEVLPVDGPVQQPRRGSLAQSRPGIEKARLMAGGCAPYQIAKQVAVPGDLRDRRPVGLAFVSRLDGIAISGSGQMIDRHYRRYVNHGNRHVRKSRPQPGQ